MSGLRFIAEMTQLPGNSVSEILSFSLPFITHITEHLKDESDLSGWRVKLMIMGAFLWNEDAYLIIIEKGELMMMTLL